MRAKRGGSLRGVSCREDPDPEDEEEEEDLIFLLKLLCLGDCMRMMRMMRRILNSSCLDHAWITIGSLLEHCWNTFGALLEHFGSTFHL
eukprot:4364078-Heterocapsa_arctica.AAC.1